MYRSKRLYLRGLSESDVPHILEMRTDMEGIKALAGHPFPSNEFGIRKWISEAYPKDNLTYIVLAIVERETDTFVGYCTALNVNYVNSNAHVGFFLHKNGRGKGYFKEVSILFYTYLFREINLRKLYSTVLEYNTLALNADKKLGYQIDGVMKEHVFQGGKYHNVFMISLTAKDFFELHNVDEIIDNG